MTVDLAVRLRNLLELPDDDFRKLIENNIDREDAPGLWELLLHRQALDRTAMFLKAILRDVDTQLSERRAEIDAYHGECWSNGPEARASFFAARTDYHNWRRRALGFRRILDKRLTEAKYASKAPVQPQEPQVAARRVRQMETVFRLAWVISQHRDQSLKSGIVPEEHDAALWRALDLIEVETTDGPITIAKFLDDITSKPGFSPPPGPAGAR